MTEASPVERPQRPPIAGVLLGMVALVLLVGILGAIALGVFSTPSEPPRSSAELVQTAPEAIAGAPGLGYQLSIETNEAGGGQGLASTGEIDLHGSRFAGSADPGGAASMLLFGGPDRGSVVLADGLFVQAEGGPWEAVPIENATPLRPFVDSSALSTAVAGALGQAQIDPEVRTEACGAATCHVVSLIFPPRVTSDLAAFVSGSEAEQPPADLRPIEADLWFDSETEFPVRLAAQALAGPTTTRLVLDLERLDPPPSIDAPVP
jgi:hypothetical protein